jgi:hypothetical protein
MGNIIFILQGEKEAQKNWCIQGSKLVTWNLILDVAASKAHTFFFLLFICAYNLWVISPFPLLPPLPPQPLPYLPAPSFPPTPPFYQAETILPLSIILLKREYKQ